MAAGEYTTGSAWLNEEKLLEQARDMWKRLSDEQKGAYGEDYFEQALRSLEKYTKSAVNIEFLQSIYLSKQLSYFKPTEFKKLQHCRRLLNTCPI